MGVVQLKGKNIKRGLQNLVPTDLFRIGQGEACYTVFLKENGGIQDDLIIYDQGAIDGKEESILLVIQKNLQAFPSLQKGSFSLLILGILHKEECVVISFFAKKIIEIH